MTVKFYRDRSRQWRWRCVSRNGKVVADSGESYRRAVDAKRGLFGLLNIRQLEIEGYPARAK